MKILSAAQIRAWDAYTIQYSGITSLLLMEKAATQCTQFITANFPPEKCIKIFCGKGNNGGDGLATGRMLLAKKYAVTIYIMDSDSAGSEDFEHNLKKLQKNSINIFHIKSAGELPPLTKDDVVIDALFGSGLNRRLEGLISAVVEHINNCDAKVVSIDVPSGMYTDKSCKNEAVVQADITLTFQCLKLCFLMPENAPCFGNVHVLDIGLDPSFLQTIETDLSFLSKELAQHIFKPRREFVHKGIFGHVLLIAGNVGKMGAAVMSAKACLRSGAGLLTVNVPEQTTQIFHTSLPEAMCVLREDKLETEKITVTAIGPGIGTKPQSVELLNKTLDEFGKPMVIDADALNILAKHRELLAKVPEDSILTPHPKEFERLFEEADNDFERMYNALKQSTILPLVIVLKGTYTFIAYEGRGWFNTTGNSGLAKGGSGDMLTGVISGLLAQKYSSLEAALLGVYVHGLAADITLQTQSRESMLATDVIENLGTAFKQLGYNN